MPRLHVYVPHCWLRHDVVEVVEGYTQWLVRLDHESVVIESYPIPNSNDLGLVRVLLVVVVVVVATMTVTTVTMTMSIPKNYHAMLYLVPTWNYQTIPIWLPKI
jgi:hypothetical protein